MSRRQLGMMLRLAGPLTQCVGLGLMFLPAASAIILPGLTIRRIGVLLFILGLLMVLTGLSLSLFSRQPTDPRLKVRPLHLD